MRDGHEDSNGGASIQLAGEADFRLGRFEMRPSSREIGLDGVFWTLEPKVAQVLIVLTKARARIVSRNELIDRCWDGRIVSESALNRVISRIRKLSNLDSELSFRLETIAKVGYRIILCSSAQAGGTGSDGNASSLIAVPIEADPVARPGLFNRKRRGLIFGLGGGAVAACLGAAWLLRPDPKAKRMTELLEQSEVAMHMSLPDSDRQGVGFLQQAVALQPTNARAWGRLALAQTVVAQYAPPSQAQAAAVAAQKAAQQALALAPRQIDALSALALLPPYYGDWLNAERRMDAVLAVDPHHFPTLDARDFFLVAVDRCRESAKNRLAYAPTAPLDAHLQQGLVYAHWILGEIDDADRTAERALQLWPRHPGLWLSRLWLHAFTGRADRAAKYFSESETRPDFPSWMLDVLGVSMRALDTRKHSDVVAATQAIVRTLERGPSQSVNAIMILCGLGELDHAFDVADAYLLDRGALHASLNWKPGQPSVNDQHHRKTNMLFVPVAANMRADERFAPLVTSMGLAEYWRLARVTPDYLTKPPVARQS